MTLTLCDKCNCMTKTIVTSNTPVCGKCKEIRTNSHQYPPGIIQEIISNSLESEEFTMHDFRGDWASDSSKKRILKQLKMH